MKRKAPMSDTLLADLEQAAKSKPQKTDFETKKRRILERCGCL